MTNTFNTLASQESINKTVKSLIANGFQAEVVDTKTEALEKIKSLIPTNASIHNGSSITLKEIGFVDYLKSDTHGWNNLHANILAKKSGGVKVSKNKRAGAMTKLAW